MVFRSRTAIICSPSILLSDYVISLPSLLSLLQCQNLLLLRSKKTSKRDSHTDFPPSTTNLSNWKNWLTTVCLYLFSVSNVLCFSLCSNVRTVMAEKTECYVRAAIPPRRRDPSRGDNEVYSGDDVYLHRLQLLQALLHQLLDLSRVLHVLVLSKCISCPPLRVFSKVVGCELFPLP